MAKPGPKPKRKKPIKWSPEVAYGVGLITTDGNLSKDGRHIDLTSKDKEQLRNFKRCFDLDTPISYKSAGYNCGEIPRLQFSDVVLYKFLIDIGLTPAKTKTMPSVDVPEKYVFDFLRGHLDGDGYFYSFWDERWENSFMFYTVFVASSLDHLEWIREIIQGKLDITGDLQKRQKGVHQLRYAKADSLKLLRKIYYDSDVVCLSRKRLKIEQALDTVGIQL